MRGRLEKNPVKAIAIVFLGFFFATGPRTFPLNVSTAALIVAHYLAARHSQGSVGGKRQRRGPNVTSVEHQQPEEETRRGGGLKKHKISCYCLRNKHKRPQKEEKQSKNVSREKKNIQALESPLRFGRSSATTANI